MGDANRQTVRVELGERSYDVIIGDGLLSEAGAHVAPLCLRQRVAVIADETAFTHHGARLMDSLAGAGLTAEVVEVAPGEGSKSFATLERICNRLLDAGMERGEPVIAFGGGVVGDLGGFVAAILKRGVPYIQIPTTLLSQVDSSVGGKTAINANAGKNLIGAFHQPSLVLADVSTVDTLHPRDVRAGYAEMIKYPIISDPPLFDWLAAHGEALVAGDKAAQVEGIAHSVKWKAHIVAMDEREAGARALLNLGHTFGHAFEAEAGYGSQLRHGEAIATGTLLAANYARQIGLCDDTVVDAVLTMLHAGQLATQARDLDGAPFDADAILGRMAHDKKNKDGQIRLVLPRRMGLAQVVTEEKPERLRAFLQDSLR